MHWKVVMMEVGSTVNKRRLQYCADELTHRQTIADSSVLKVTQVYREAAGRDCVAEVYGVTVEVA